MYVLIATSAGDELRPPERKWVMASFSRAKLEALKVGRAEWRAKYLANHQIQDESRGSLIAWESVEEVDEV